MKMKLVRSIAAVATAVALTGIGSAVVAAESPGTTQVYAVHGLNLANQSAQAARTRTRR